MRHFFLDTSGGLPAPGETVVLDRDESHHLKTVLRGGRDTELHLVDGRGHRLTAHADGRDGKRVVLRIASVAADAAEVAAPRLALACAVVKGKRFEWALEKAVELGAHRILPLRCEHGVIDPREGKRERWLTIMKAALKQCGRSWLPDLEAPLKTAAALDGCGAAAMFYGTAPGEFAADAVTTWEDLLPVPPAPLPAELVFWVGPEGGWSPAELDLLGARARPVSLGPHVLRAETAAAAGLTALQTLRRAWRRTAP